MFRRHFLVSLVCLASLAGLPAGHAAEAEFVRIWPQWRNVEDFERIGEYFGAPENPGRQHVLRTHANERAGYYFLVRVKHAAALAGGKFDLHIIRSDKPDTLTFTFPVAAGAAAGEQVFQLGLTGADWPGGKSAQPVAWKLELRDAGGRTLATQKSFLWEKPAK